MQKTITIEKLENSQVKIKFEIPWIEVEKEREHVISYLQRSIKIDGFRDGKAPADVIEKHMGPASFLQEMASHLIGHVFPEVLQEENIDAIGEPHIQITKLAQNNPLEFTAVISVLPVIKLADYKKIAKKFSGDIQDTEIKDSDVEETVNHIKTMYAKRKLFETMQKETKEGGEEIENNKDESPDAIQKRIDEKLEIPELTDEFVKELGPFETVNDFKEKIKENLKLESRHKSQEEFRIKTIEAVVDESEMEVPQLLIGMEVEKMMVRMKGDVEKMGMKFSDYLNNLKKSEDDLKKEMEHDAKKRAGAQLVINKIAKEEHLVPDESKVVKEIEAIIKVYPDVSPEHARGYIENIMLNDLVLKFLEEQK